MAATSSDYLDMVLEDPPPDALQVVRRVLDGLLGSTVDWDDRTYALKGAGRVPLTGDDIAELGDRAARFPLTG